MPAYEFFCQRCFRAFVVDASLEEYCRGLAPSCPCCGLDDGVRARSMAPMIARSRELERQRSSAANSTNDAGDAAAEILEVPERHSGLLHRGLVSRDWVETSPKTLP